jgi:hypothetical protein
MCKNKHNIFHTFLGMQKSLNFLDQIEKNLDLNLYADFSVLNLRHFQINELTF